MGKEKRNPEIKKVDAVAMYSTNPESMPNSLLQRERIIVSILAHYGMPLPAELVRKAYLELVFDNIRRNLELIDAIMLMQKLAEYENGKLPKGAFNEIRKAVLDFPVRYGFWSSYSKEDHIKKLSELYHQYFPKQRKVPLLISGITVQSMLDNMASFYGNFIETRLMQSGRKMYYLNPEFLKLWRKNDERIVKALTEADYSSRSGEAEFYDMVNKLLAKRTDKTLEELAAVFENHAKKAKRAAPSAANSTKAGIPRHEAMAHGGVGSTSSRFINEIIPIDDATAEFLRGIISKIDQIEISELMGIMQKDIVQDSAV